MQTRKNVRRATLLAISLLIAATSVFGQAPQKCDVNGDGVISLTDINLIVAALNQPATGPSDPRDADNNGVINALDARTCTTRCTFASCGSGPTNTAPAATNDSYSTPEDTTLVVAAPGVLGNDTDAQNNPLTAAVVTGPASGTLVLSSNGSFSYMPAPNFSGTVTFTYRANDGALNSNIATVTINVTAVNDGPTALPDTYSTAEDTPLSVAAPGVLANDGDVDGPTLTAQLVAGPVASAGTVTLNGNGSFLFTPAANFTGAATFTYVASDGLLPSSVTMVTVNVTPLNDVPVANADSYSTDEDVTLVVAAPGVLGNDSDVEGSSLSAILGTPPATGTLVLSPNGSFTYTPAPNFSGTASFTYRASDGVATSSPATVSLTVLSINDLPVAANDNYSTNQDTQLAVAAPGVLGNDTDQEGSGLTAVLATGPANGTLVLNANGSFTYTPNAGFAGTNTFTYRANDGNADSNPATVTINVNAPGPIPTANNDSYSTQEDTQLVVAAPGVLGNDTNVGSLTASLVAGPATGNLTLNPNGSFTFTPAANFNGAVTFSYRLTDGVSNSNTATVTISVTPVNDAPVAGDDSYSTPEDTQLLVAAPGVLGNDIDVEGTPLFANLVSGPASGLLTLSSNGGFIYTPNLNFNGSDSFTYRASDGALFSNVATVSLTITPVNDPPVAGNESYSTTAGVTLTVAAPGVLGNDTDVEGTTLTAVLVASPASGTLNLASDGSFTYVPAAGFTGPVTFTYRASDGVAQSALATVTITVTAAPNSPPVAVNDGYSTPEDTALVIAAPGVLGNDTDADGNVLTAIQVTGPAQGNLTLNANGSFTYTPPPQFNGPVTFTYRANDGIVDSSNVATVTINVTPVNDAPVGNPDTYSTPEDTQLIVSAPGVLGNDTDPEGDALTAGLVSGPASGSLTLLSTGAFQYTPALNFNGQVSFMYRANDGVANSNVTTVTINVTPINDAPVANLDSYSTNEDTTLTVAAPGVLGNDMDVEGTGLTAILVTPPVTGTLTLNPNGSFTYVPQANLSGSPVTFTYRVSDGLLQSTPATVTITVLPINDAPVAQDDSYSTPIGTTLNVVAPGVLANDTDQEGSGLTAVLDAGPTKGSLTLNANGSFSYTPNVGASVSDAFTYHAFDGLQGSNIATVTISLTGGTMTLTVQDPFIAIGGSTQGTITLSTPAPVGGTSVQLTSTATGVATVSPATVVIAQGQTTGSFTVNGVAAGNATIDGTAPGFSNGSVGVTVTPSVITVGNVTVAPGGQAQFPVTLSTPAPAGGLTVTLTSLNTGIATVPASVVIPAGQTFANPNPMVTGVAPGVTTIRGTAPSYAPGAGTATVAIAASFSPNPVVVVEGATAQTTLTLAQPAPAGGITVNLVTAVPARATVASPVTIAAGQSSAQVTVTGVQQGSTLLTATGVGLVTTTATINVTPPPAITLPDQTLGKDLQVAITFSLGAPAPAGNLIVTINSSNPAKMVVAPNATTAGSASIPITITAGQTSGTFYAQALDSTGVVAAQVSAPGYANGQASITLAPSGLYLLAPAGNFTTGVGSGDTPLRVCAARLNGTTVQTTQEVRGGLAVNAAATSSSTSVGTIVNSPFVLTGGNSCTPSSGASALAFHPVGLGNSTVTLVQPAGFTTPATQQSVIATVGAPISLSTPSAIGKDLQRQISISLGAPAPAGNLVVTITSSDATKLLVSSSGTTAGGATATVTIPAGSSSGSFFAQALVSSGTADITASAPGYSPATVTAPLSPSGFRLNESDFTIGVSAVNTPISVCPVTLNASNVFQGNSILRGGLTVNIAATSSNTAAGVIVGSPFAFTGGNGCQNTVAFDPIAAGTTTVALTQPAGFNTPTTGQSVVVTVQASITANGTTIGKDLQVSASMSLGSPAPAGNLLVTIDSADPARLLVAPNATTAGTASITITIAAGSSSGSYVVQALDSTGTVSVNVSAPGYTSGVGTMTLVPSGFIINSPNNFATTTLDPNQNIQVCASRLNPATLAWVTNGTLRFGIAPVGVSITSSNAAVGTIVNATQSIAGNAGCTPNSAAGFQFDPVGAGTSTIAMGPTPAGFSTPTTFASIVATVTASGVNLSAQTVGKNLQTTASGSLQAPAPAGGTSVTLTSADASKLLLAPNATTAGSASIVVNVAQGSTSFSYTVQALDGTGTVQVNATAPGFGSGAATITLVPSGFIINSPNNFTTNTLDLNTNIQLCVARLNPTTLAWVTNGTLRFGIAPVSVGVTSSSPAVGTIVGSPQSIAANASCTTGAAIQFDPMTAGSSTIAMIAPPPAGFSAPSTFGSIVATVVASGIGVNASTVGKNLQASTNGSLQSPAPAGGVAVTLTSADPSKLLLAPNATTAGSASIVVNVAQGGTSIPYWVQALDDAGTVQVTATAPGFTSGAGTITLNPSGFIIETPGNFSTTTLSANTNVQVCVARLNPTTLNWTTNGTLRFGVAPVSVGVTSSNPAVGAIVGSPQSIAANTSCTTPAAAIQFDPATAGSSVIAMGPTPAGFSTPSNFVAVTATVTATGINLNTSTLGKDMQATVSGSLQAPAPAGGVTVTLTSADPAKLVVSPNATTAGSAFITVNVAAGGTGFTYVGQALSSVGPVQVTASAPGFVNGNVNIDLVPSGFIIESPGNFSTTAAAANTSIQICASRLNPTTLNWATNTTLRFGIAPVSVSMTSSNPATGVIVNTPQSIAGNASCTVTTAAGMKFDPLAPGTSILNLGAVPGFSTPSNFQAINATVN